MADPRRRDTLVHATIFTLIALSLMFVQLLPLGTGGASLPGPDVLLMLVFSWVLWRPDFVPVLLIAAIFLLADILLMRPPGLWAGLVVLASEYLRRRSHVMRGATFAFDWLVVAGVTCAVFLANALILTIFAAERAPLGLTLIQLLATVAVYPLVVVLGGRAFGLRRLAQGEVDRLGHRQ